VRVSICLLLCSILVSLGCGDAPAVASRNGTAPVGQAAGKAAGHAPADVVPGFHEDWCGEHQVPESLCTRCNPELIAAFKATNDWCGEHGLPESQCLVCNPELKIERPPKTEAR